PRLADAASGAAAPAPFVAAALPGGGRPRRPARLQVHRPLPRGRPGRRRAVPGPGVRAGRQPPPAPDGGAAPALGGRPAGAQAGPRHGTRPRPGDEPGPLVFLHAIAWSYTAKAANTGPSPTDLTVDANGGPGLQVISSMAIAPPYLKPDKIKLDGYSANPAEKLILTGSLS